MKQRWREILGGLLGVLIIMGVLSWSVYFASAELLKAQWQHEAGQKVQRLERALSDTQAQLRVLADCMAASLKTVNASSVGTATLVDESLVERLNISEITLKNTTTHQTIEVVRKSVAPTADLWRASLYDLKRTGMPQEALELTEYGPRITVLTPIHWEGGDWVLEVAVPMDEFLEDYARRESCEVAFIIPQQRWLYAQAPIIIGEHQHPYVLAAATHPRAARFLALPEVAKNAGRSGYGMLIDEPQAWGLAFLSQLEYQSENLPELGSTVSMVLWSDYTDTIAQLNASRRGTLAALWAVGGIFGLSAAFFGLRYRKRIKGRLGATAETLKATNYTLQREVQNRQKTEEQLRGLVDEVYAAQQSDKLLLSAHAHELKVVASGIVGYATLLREPMQNPVDHADAVTELFEAGDRVLRQAENLECWARRDSWKKNFAPRLLPVDDTVAQIRRLFEARLARKELKLELAIEKKLSVWADAALLEVCLKNILWNAIKFSQRGQSIKLSVRATPVGVEFVFSDQGVGISSSQMRRIFDANPMTAQRGTEGEEGLGLGLGLVQWAAECHHALLSVVSEEGQGCRVALTFPLPPQ